MKKISHMKQLPANLLSNIGVFILGTLIGLYLTPFFLKHIGLDGYGVIRLALVIPTYLGLATLVISGTVSRFLTIDLQKNDITAANETFNTALFGMLSILLILLPVIFLFSFYVDTFFIIPAPFASDAVFLFLGIMLSSSVTVFSAMFMIPAFANNRLDINNYVRISIVLIQTLLMVFLVYWWTFPLASVGGAHFVAALFGMAISVKVWKRFAPAMSIKFSSFRISKFKELSSMGTWLIIDQIGTILFLYVDLLVVNYIFGAEATGEYSIPLQWQTMLRSLGSVLAGVIAPVILISYARKEYSKIIELSYVSVKFLGLALAIPIGLIAGFAPTLLKVWVGEEFVHLVPLLWLIVLPLSVNLAFSALFPINTAYNKIKIPAYITLSTGILSLFLALLFTLYFDFGLYGVAMAGAIAFTGRNLLFTVFYTAYLTGASVFEYYKRFLMGVAVTGSIFMLSYLIQQFAIIENWFALIVWMSIVGVSILPIIWFIITRHEKQMILKILRLR